MNLAKIIYLPPSVKHYGCEVRDTKVLVEKTYNIRRCSAVPPNKHILGDGNKKSLIPFGALITSSAQNQISTSTFVRLISV